MVRPVWRRREYATALSNASLEGLSVERVTLMVQPFDDSPVHEAMVREMKD
jgi:hypothetical protein